MQIKFLALKRFVPFVFNNVELLELSNMGDVQNIIGTNGSGKSSLLRELNPRPAVRSDFRADGYKHIDLTHNGSEYLLKSEFINVSAPHSFLKDGEELNPSGTTPVQEELVRRELGYTPQVHAISYGEQRLSSIRIGLRESYLLTIHPCRMKLLLDKHTTIEKKIRSYKNNLSMLQERRTALSSQLIDETLRQTMKSESETLTHEIAIIVEFLHKLTNQRQNIITTLNTYPTTYTTRSKHQRLLARRRYPAFQKISREKSVDELRNVFVGMISSLKTEKESVTRHIQTLTQEINKYEQHIRQSDSQGAVDHLEMVCKTIRTDIDILIKDTVDQPFDTYCLNEIPDHIRRLTDIVAAFIDYGERIPSSQEVSLLEEKLSKTQRSLMIYEQQRDERKRILHRLETSLREKLLDGIPSGCHNCVLFVQYSETTSRLQIEYKQVDDELTKINLRIARLTKISEGRQKRLLQYNQIFPQLKKLSDYLNEYRYLLIPFKDLDLLTILRQNPSLLLVKLQRHYEKSQNYYLLKKKQEELIKSTADCERLKKPSEFSRLFLEEMIIEKRDELSILQDRYTKLYRDTVSKEMFLSDLLEYKTELETLLNEKRVFEQQLEYETLKFDRNACDYYIAAFEKAKTYTITRLSEIDRVLREQDTILARHQEITDNITDIETQLQNHLRVEKALSPTTGIPYRYMVQFINDLCHDANTFINEVFGYPFEFIPLAPGDPLDYKFKMKVGDTPVPDISLCSDAQKDMADLAFRLAQIVHLRQSGYGIYLDEYGKTFDHYHRQKLLSLFKSLRDDGVVSQLFMIDHNVLMYGGLQDTDILVLNENNIILPNTYNTHAKIEYYQ